MSNVRMVMINEFDAATVSQSAGVTVPTLPATNMQFYNNSRIWRSLSVDLSVLQGNFADLQLLSAFILWRHNLTNSSVMRLQLYAAPNQTGALVYDSGEIPAIQQITFGDWDWRIQPVVASALDTWDVKYSQHWFNSVFARSYRITLKDPLNPAPHLDCARIYLGRHFEPAVNFSYGRLWQLGSNEQQFRTDDGSLFSNTSPRWRTAQFSFDYIDDADRPGLMAALRYAGISQDFFISLYPEEGGQREVENAYACKFKQHPAVTNTAQNNYKIPLIVEEC
jgi:hypothetical protein